MARVNNCVIQESGIVWDEKNLNKYLKHPDKFVHGTKKKIQGKIIRVLSTEVNKDFFTFKKTSMFFYCLVNIVEGKGLRT